MKVHFRALTERTMESAGRFLHLRFLPPFILSFIRQQRQPPLPVLNSEGSDGLHAMSESKWSSGLTGDEWKRAKNVYSASGAPPTSCGVYLH